MGQTHYEILGVEADADAETIKRTFRKLMRQYHPDISGPEGTAISAVITESYNVLRDPERRSEYDHFLNDEPDSDEGVAEYNPDDYEDDWGEQAEWVPQDDDAPVVEDSSLPPDEDQPPEESEPSEDWGDEEVIEDVVVEEGPAPVNPAPPEPNPQPTPKPPLVQEQEYSPVVKDAPAAEPPKVKFRQPKRFAGYALLAGFVLALSGYVLMALGDTPQALEPLLPRLGAVLAATVLGLGLGGLLRSDPKPDPRRPQKRSKPRPNFAAAMVISVLLSLVATFLIPNSFSILRGALVVLLGWAAGSYVAIYYLRQQKRLDAFVPMRTLKESNTFGTLPGGVAADLLNRDLSALYSNPALRMMRTSVEGKPFSHALVVGERVALVRAVMGGGGIYRWSGPSLLREVPGQYPQEVMRGPYGESVRSFRGLLGPKVRVETWLFLYDPQGGAVLSPEQDFGMPTVAAPREGIAQLWAFLSPEEPLVDHQVVVDAALALNS